MVAKAMRPLAARIPRSSSLISQLQPRYTLRPISNSQLLPTRSRTPQIPSRAFTTTLRKLQNQYSHPNEPQRPSFYRTHGRAFFKSFTLAFLTYQIIYWFWLTIESEEIRDTKDAEIKGLEGEVRLLDEGRKGHVDEWEKRRRNGHHGHRGFVDSEGDVDERESD